jgi:nicotinate dehydrogenase subunit B
MNALFDNTEFSRRALLRGGALTIAFALSGATIGVPGEAAAQASAPRNLDPTNVDAFLAINADGTVTLYCGKVDLGTGLRAAIPQMAAEELGLTVGKIKLVEGDTALTPDQGATAGSTGIMRGGVQIRQAAATARKALLDLAAARLNAQADELDIKDGVIAPRKGGDSVTFAALLAGKQFELKLDPKASLKNPRDYTIVGQSVVRPDVPAKCTGTFHYVHDHSVPGMLHGRTIRAASIGAKLLSVDDSGLKSLRGVQVVRIQDFLGVVAEDEWTCVRAMRALKVEWGPGEGLPEQNKLADIVRAMPVSRDETIVNKPSPVAAETSAKSLKATYYWPMQSHASMGPSCAVADVREDGATIWTASQATHRFAGVYARMLGMPPARVRLIYLDGSGCYGMNGHDDAAADAILLSRAVKRPVRVQWTREDELGWDPKGPAQLLDMAGTINPDGTIAAWQVEMWVPEATRGLPNVPLLAPVAAGMGQTPGLSTGLITQNADTPYTAPATVTVHWLKESPLRLSNLRAPGKVANSMAVEGFVDEMAAAVGMDPLELRLKSLKNPRGLEVLRKAAEMLNWQARPSPAPQGSGNVATGRGIAYVHYKHNETYVAMGMEVAVDRASGKVKVTRVTCAHDCGLMINPDGVKAQVEGCIIQTLSRALYEEVSFDRAKVTSVDWASYPIMTFPDVPKLEIALIDRPTEPPLGAGEAATAPVAAALTNAIFDATGARMRVVPFTPERVRAAMARRST